VRAHEPLKIEVGELVLLLQLQKLGELRVWVDFAAIVLILKVVSTNILVDLPCYLSASHLGARRLGQERSQLLANESRLHETTWGTVA